MTSRADLIAALSAAPAGGAIARPAVPPELSVQARSLAFERQAQHGDGPFEDRLPCTALSELHPIARLLPSMAISQAGYQALLQRAQIMVWRGTSPSVDIPTCFVVLHADADSGWSAGEHSLVPMLAPRSAAICCCAIPLRRRE